MGVTKGDITEICCFSKPPIAVAQVACAFATLLNNKSVTDWGRKWSKKTQEFHHFVRRIGLIRTV